VTKFKDLGQYYPGAVILYIILQYYTVLYSTL